MNRNIALVILFLTSFHLFAAEDDYIIESISNIDAAEMSDTLLSLYTEYNQLLETMPDSAELIANSFIEVSELNQLNVMTGLGYLLKGNALLNEDMYDESVYNYLKAKDLFDQSGDILFQILSLNHLGLAERSSNNYNKAIDYFEKALQLSKLNQLAGYEAMAYNYLGGVYLRKTDYIKADEFYKQSLKIREEIKDTTDIAASRVNIALVKREVGDYDEAIQNLDNAYELYSSIDDIRGMADVATLQGSILFRKNNFNEALVYYYEAYNIRKELDNPLLIARSATNIGTAYKNLSMADSASKYYHIALELNEYLNYKNGVSASLNNLGNLYQEVNDLANAMEYYIKALSLRQNENSHQLAGTLKNIGNIYNSINRYDKALEYYLQAVEIEESLGDKKRLAYTLDFIGNSYKVQENHDEALKYYNRALDIKKQIGNQKGIAITLNNIGDLFFEQNKFKEAENFYNQSLKAGELSDDRWRIAQELNNIGNIYHEKDESDQALDYYLQANEINKEIKNRFGEALVARKIGEIYLWDNQYEAAIPFIERSLNIGMQMNNQVLIRNALYALYEYYRNTEDYQKAMLYLYDYYAVQDSMLTQLSNKKVYDIQLNYEIEKREEKIDQIQKEKDVLNIEKELQTEKLVRKNIVLFSLGGLLLLLVIIILLIFNRYNYRKKITQMLNEKINIIESTNKALQASQEELKTSNATKDKFFSIIAHDLKNPIGGLMMASEAVNKPGELTEEERKEYVSVMHKSARQLFVLLDNLLIWSRSQTGRIKFSPALIFVKKLVQQNIDLLSVNTEAKNLSVNNRLHEELECYIDEELMSTVFRNILSNAIKFTPVGGKITITGKESDHNVEVSISDTGVGMSNSQIDNLFKIDKTSSTAGTNNESGSGLGLIIVSEFVLLNKGNIEVESLKGKGTTFKITLPKQKFNG